MRSGAPKSRGRGGHRAAPQYRLRLYLAGQSPRSLAALDNLRRLCDTYLRGRCRVDVVDLLKHPGRAQRDQIIALPTLVRQSPRPQRRVVGDISDFHRVLAELELHPVEAER